MSHPFGILHVMDQDLMGSNARVIDLARRQHGLITSSQAVACGITKRSIDHRVATGSWSGILRGVYVIGGAPDTFQQRLLAQVLHVGPDAVASHVAAARIWGLPGFGEQLEWTRPRGRSQRRPAGRCASAPGRWRSESRAPR